MVVIILHLFVLVFDVIETLLNYTAGKFVTAIILAALSGVLFSNIIWMIINKFQE